MAAMAAARGSQRGPGRPRKWDSDAERMRAYRARKRAERESLERRADQGELFERFRTVTGERDALRREVNELRARVRALETEVARADSSRAEPLPRTDENDANSAGPFKPSRAERRRREREARKRRPRN